MPFCSLDAAAVWNRASVGVWLSRAVVGTTPAVGAAFVEGFLAGSGTVLVHDAELLDVIDGWVSSLAPEAFISTAAAAAPHVRACSSRRSGADRRADRAMTAAPAARSAPAASSTASAMPLALATVAELLGVAR